LITLYKLSRVAVLKRVPDTPAEGDIIVTQDGEIVRIFNTRSGTYAVHDAKNFATQLQRRLNNGG